MAFSLLVMLFRDLTRCNVLMAGFANARMCAFHSLQLKRGNNRKGRENKWSGRYFAGTFI